MKKLLFVIVWMLGTAGLAAQHRIEGQVLEQGSRQPLPGATVLLKGQAGQGAVADAEGRFVLQVPAEGIYPLRISFVGYQPQEVLASVPAEAPLQVVLPLLETALSALNIYGNRTYPITKTELAAPELARQNLGQDLPILLNFTPSIVTTSDAGAGVGYTGMRIRGSDAQRINVTVNGIPLNDAESHGVFWVNMPDFASSVQGVAIQRGVGTSTNGAAAFGASVNLTTQTASEEAFAEWNGAYGSFNTWKNNVQFGTGRLQNGLSVTGRLSKITSDGYIDNAWSDLKSFFVTADYRGKAGHITANVFSGKEVTFQAWNGVEESVLRSGNRTFNELAGYDNEVDDYQQDHYQLLYDRSLGGHWMLQGALHYTKGRGYFEQFRADDALADYGLDAGGVLVQDPETGEYGPLASSDLIRRRWLDNDFYGAVYSLQYQRERLEWVFGGGWNRYEGGHFGEVVWAAFMPQRPIRHRYYDNDATKTDANVYTKATYEVAEGLRLFGDLQLRRVRYEFLGFDADLSNVAQTDKLLFFNPKAGLRYAKGRHEAHLLLAVANKEPNRDDYTESSTESRPRHETLRNVELGYSGEVSKQWALAANAYWMDYDNQLVLTGQVNDVGAYGRTNIARSYRMGLELQAKWLLGERLRWEGNATFSRNKAVDFAEYLDAYDADFNYLGQRRVAHGTTDLAFSPNVVAGSQLAFMPAKGLELAWLAKYVGRQYLDNTSDAGRQLDAYFTHDLRLSWAFSAGMLRQARITLLVNNVFGALYESNGYTYGWLEGERRATVNYYYPQAGTNALLGITLRF